MVVSRSDKKARYFHLSQSLKKLGKYVARGKRRSIAHATVENGELRHEVVTAIGNAARKEIKKICSDSHDSILRMKLKPALEHFTWERVWTELQNHAPLLMSLLLQLLPPSKREGKNVRAALCICISIILKLHCQKVNLVQAIISLLLKAGHATKQVHILHFLCNAIMQTVLRSSVHIHRFLHVCTNFSCA